MKCPKKFTCESYNCCKHCKQDYSTDTPVHIPCKWYSNYEINYENQQIRKQKIMKINGK